jgi:hypothetical protein
VLKDIRGTIIDNTNENNDITKEIIDIKELIIDDANENNEIKKEINDI